MVCKIKFCVRRFKNNILQRRLRFTVYKLEMFPRFAAMRKTFAGDIVDGIEADEKFLNRLMFSDTTACYVLEATFHTSGHLIYHNV